ncbi:hypothetical protein DM02DRAFT_617190 [Periconia macrospinosa]|uniref:Gag1-like clamp domain-containing protein n=1 Tax=Periconia macrospinosa TaxID=97972 RepID=A0A2V1DEQ3_9PLEO|nr:hypothetical protein DM02DRAFT_617190 [Periconia macrospinosa]
MDSSSTQSASRAARRFLDQRVRTDWDWPTPPPCWEASDEEVRGVTSFRERFYGDSSPSSTSDNDDDDAANADNPYKFDTPDSIGGMVERKAERKRRKRDQRLRDEMKENEGLRIFIARRDRWTGVDSVRKYGASANNKTTSIRHTNGESDASEKTTVIPDSSTGGSGVGDKTPTTSIEAASPGSSPTSPTAPPDALAALSLPPPPPPTSTPSLIPVALPLLPTNPLRTSITSRTYPDIYSKIVLQSRTPTVPINLADMTKALVQGWRDNGEWPPKQAALDPLPGSRTKRGLGGLTLGFSLGGGARGDGERAPHNAHKGGGGGASVGEGSGAFLGHHPHLQKGVGGLKRMFHLNGHTPPSSPPPPRVDHKTTTNEKRDNSTTAGSSGKKEAAAAAAAVG